MFFHSFHSIRPEFESSQEDTLKWLLEAYTKSKRGSKTKEEIQKSLEKVACGPSHISKRGHILSDFLHTDWSDMQVYQLEDFERGGPLSQRSKVFQKTVDEIVERFYLNQADPPDEILHVTCTGYNSPSAIQKMVSKKGWEKQTTVTHIYHMGCYASIPALRVARGLLLSSDQKQTADVVHTEVSSLHCDPSNDTPGQMISQTLFADGFIKYSLSKKANGSGFYLHDLREEIIPNSMDAMTWDMSDHGFEMCLSKQIPFFIIHHLEGYLKRLVGERKCLFAIHPGGPKILSFIQKLLSLSDEQLFHSYQVFKNFGNMSSATLPHILKGMLEDPLVPEKVPIVLLAFGPGLTIAGGVVEKVCGP